MTYRLIIKALAERDISQALKWYSKQSIHLPGKFIKDFDRSLQTLIENPKQYQKRYGTIRIVFPKRFPYGIIP